MKKILLNILWFSLAAALMYIIFNDTSVNELKNQLDDLNYFWLFTALIVSIFCHWLRGYRWTMLLSAAGTKVPVNNAFGAVMVGYMFNNFTIRVGEVSRCVMLNRSDRVPVPVSVGTVFTERAVDMITLGLLVALALFLEWEVLWGYIVDKNTGRTSPIMPIILWGLGIGLSVAILIYIGRKHIKNNPIVAKVTNFVVTILISALSIFKLSRPFLFIIISVGIWFGYILVNYLFMLALPATSHLSFYQAVIVTAMGGVAMVIPSPGGVGAFHFAFTETFKIYRLGESLGKILALVIHTPQFILNSIVGMVYFILLTRKTTNNSDISHVNEPANSSSLS